MSRTILAVLFAGAALASQNPQPPSIQGVWRNVARVIPATTVAGERIDPFAHVPAGTQTDVQPGLLIFTKQHYSRTTDTAVAPRPSGGPAVPEKATLEELLARWGPFQANAGRYEMSGNTVTLRPLVAKEPSDQGAGSFARLLVSLEGDTLSLTPLENSRGRIAAGVTSKYVRVE